MSEAMRSETHALTPVGGRAGASRIVVVIADQNENDVQVFLSAALEVADGARRFAKGFRPGIVEIAAVENVIAGLGIAFFGGAGLMGERAARTDPGKARAIEDGGRGGDIMAIPSRKSSASTSSQVNFTALV